MKKLNRVCFKFLERNTEYISYLCFSYFIKIIFKLYYVATGENTPEHSSSNAEATAMSVVEEDSPEIICFQEFQNTPVSSAVIIHIYKLF